MTSPSMHSAFPRRTITSPALRRGRGEVAWSPSQTRLRGGFGHDVDDPQAELPLGSVHEVQLQPAGNTRRQGADDEGIVARVGEQFVGDRLQRLWRPNRSTDDSRLRRLFEQRLGCFGPLPCYVNLLALPRTRTSRLPLADHAQPR